MTVKKQTRGLSSARADIFSARARTDEGEVILPLDEFFMQGVEEIYPLRPGELYALSREDEIIEGRAYHIVGSPIELLEGGDYALLLENEGGYALVKHYIAGVPVLTLYRGPGVRFVARDREYVIFHIRDIRDAVARPIASLKLRIKFLAEHGVGHDPVLSEHVGGDKYVHALTDGYGRFVFSETINLSHVPPVRGTWELEDEDITALVLFTYAHALKRVGERRAAVLAAHLARNAAGEDAGALERIALECPVVEWVHNRYLV